MPIDIKCQWSNDMFAQLCLLIDIIWPMVRMATPVTDSTLKMLHKHPLFKHPLYYGIEIGNILTISLVCYLHNGWCSSGGGRASHWYFNKCCYDTANDGCTYLSKKIQHVYWFEQSSNRSLLWVHQSIGRGFCLPRNLCTKNISPLIICLAEADQKTPRKLKYKSAQWPV